MDTKVCTKCKRELPATEEFFCKKSKCKFGINSVCKSCSSTRKTEVKHPKEGYKFCSKCNRELPATNEFFYFNNKNKTRLSSRCKECTREYDNSEKRKAVKREWVSRNLEKRREVARKSKQIPKAKAKQRLAEVLRSYGLTEDDLVSRLDSQKGCCEICGDSLVYPDSKRFYTVDHNHTTGEVRGLLCNECNLAIGNLKEDKNIFLSAIKYLEKYNE